MTKGWGMFMPPPFFCSRGNAPFAIGGRDAAAMLFFAGASFIRFFLARLFGLLFGGGLDLDGGD